MTNKGKIVLALVGLGVAGIVALAVSNDATRRDPDTGKQRPDTPEARREFVRLISKDMPPDSMWTEGARSEVLVVDLRDCTLVTLTHLAHQPEMASRLYQFDFASLRCTNGVQINGPFPHL